MFYKDILMNGKFELFQVFLLDQLFSIQIRTVCFLLIVAVSVYERKRISNQVNFGEFRRFLENSL